MPAITIALDGVNLKDIPLTKARTTLGRRPYNDIVMDHLAVSGEHAVFALHDDGVELLDLHSTNGTYVNGKAIVSARVGPHDLIEIGRYQIRVKTDVVAEASTPQAEPSGVPGHNTQTEGVPDTVVGHAQARIQVLNGPASGREMTLTKVVTTLGKPGVAVAAITHRGAGYVLSRVEGDSPPSVNGQGLGAEAVGLRHNDVISLAGTEMKFLLE